LIHHALAIAPFGPTQKMSTCWGVRATAAMPLTAEPGAAIENGAFHTPLFAF
jgi:hypothetical protein